MDDKGAATGPPDDGLKRLLTYTFVALVLAVIAALVGASLAVRFFDTAG